MESSTGNGDISSVHTGSRLAIGIGVGSQEGSVISLSVTLANGMVTIGIRHSGMESSTGNGDISSVHTGSRLVIGIGKAIGRIVEGWVSVRPSIGSSHKGRYEDKGLHDELDA